MPKIKEDLIKKRVFNKLTPKMPVGKTPAGKTLWSCECQCGRFVQVATGDLMSGNRTSCGQCKGLVKIGIEFKRLVVIEDTGEKNDSHKIWLCHCLCGNYTKVSSSNLVSGAVRSCGCIRVEKSTKHGLTGTQIYETVKGVKARCTNPHHSAYANYGGRGIAIWPDWINDLGSFAQWCLDNGWHPGLTIERQDNDGNYEPNNIKFVTQERQNNNRRSNHNVSVFGETLSLMDAVKKYSDLDYHLVKQRIKKLKWTPERALTQPATPPNGTEETGMPVDFWEAFAIYVPEATETCWEWLGSKDSGGYGRISYKNKRYKAHRMSYLLWKGKIEKGMEISHSCDNPSCINPKHLVQCTRKANQLDRIQKKRGKVGVSPRPCKFVDLSSRI